MGRLTTNLDIKPGSDPFVAGVVVSLPFSWHLITYCLLAMFSSAIFFLSFADYARVEMASGLIAAEKGVAGIVPSRAGVITEVRVSAGEMVSKGDSLVTVRVDEDLNSGQSVAALTEAAIVLQDKKLIDQARETVAAAQQQAAQVSAQRTGFTLEVNNLQSQAQLQSTLVKSAEIDLTNARKIAENGFISKRDIQNREEILISRQQQLAQLNQAIASKRSGIVESDYNIARLEAQSRTETAIIAASRAQLAQQAASSKSAQAYVLKAPVAGEISNVTARLGLTVSPNSNLMSILPRNVKFNAELSVPSSAIGFVRPGQNVRLALDAFPYQRFGTVTGKVKTVAQSALVQQNPTGGTSLVYPVIVELDQQAVFAYGRKQKIMAGMTLSARIVTEKQTLLRWLFDPIFAVRRR